MSIFAQVSDQIFLCTDRHYSKSYHFCQFISSTAYTSLKCKYDGDMAQYRIKFYVKCDTSKTYNKLMRQNPKHVFQTEG